MDLRASNSIFKCSHKQNYLVAGGCDSLALMADVDTLGVQIEKLELLDSTSALMVPVADITI